MTRPPRGNHCPAFKAKVALAAGKGEKTLAKLAPNSMSTRMSSRSGGTMFSWKGSGGPAKTRRFTCKPMPASLRRRLCLADTATASTISADPIRALTGRRWTRPVLPRCHQCRWRPNQGRKPLRERDRTVQTNRAASEFALHLNVTTGLVRQWERGEKQPSGAAMKLLTLVARKGLQAVA